MLATKVTPAGTFINASHFTFFLFAHIIILFTTLGTRRVFLYDGHTIEGKGEYGLQQLGPEAWVRNLEVRNTSSLVLPLALPSSTVHRLLVTVASHIRVH